MRHPADLVPPLIEPADLDLDPLPEALRGDEEAVRVTLSWARQYLCRPHPELGRKGNVCPYVEASLAKRAFLLALHRGRPGDPAQVAALLVRYRDWFVELEPRTGPEAQFKTILVLFPDLRPEEVPLFIDGAQRALKREFVPAGLMVGEFHAGPPDKPGLWNPDFRPLRSPVPLLAIRHMVPTDFLFLQDTAAFVTVYLTRFGDRVPSYLLGPVLAAAERFGLRPPTGTSDLPAPAGPLPAADRKGLRMTLDDLPPAEKRARLARMLRSRSAAPQAYPLSFGQQRLWFLDKFSPGDPVYNIPVATRLTGPLDLDVLRRGLDRVVARHAALRTTFPDQGGEPVQVVAPAGAVELTVHDLSGPDPAGPPDSEQRATRFAGAQAALGFDLQRGPLIRAAVGRLGPDDHALVLTLHHIVSDAWSISVLFGELSACYRAELAGTEPELPEVALQYPDFAVWQHDRMRGDLLARQLAYWTDHLAGAPALLTLPSDRPRPAAQSFRGALHHFTVPAEVVAAVDAMSRRHGATLFMALLAGYSGLLTLLSGQDDVVVGSPVAGRTHANLENLIGFFVNTLPLRVRTAGDPTFAELLARAKEATLGGLENAELPFEKLVEVLAPERSLGHAPVFQAQLILQNTPPITLGLPGVATHPLTADPGTAKFDLTLYADRTSDGLHAGVEYDTALFDAQTVRRWSDQLVALLAAAATDPARPLSELTPLSGVQRWQVVVGFNSTRRPLPPADTALDLLRLDGDRARLREAPAVRAGDRVLTYAELDERANRLAHLLVRHGVGPDVPVALCLDRSAAMLPALLAVWKAGGGYLPLDPAWPVDRLRTMLDDAAAPVLVTERAVRERLGAGLGAGTVLCLDDAADEIAALPPTPPPARPVTGQHLAYLIYTSGSTGRPKGVAVPHAAVVNLLAGFAETLALGTGDVLAAVTTLSFDISVLELLTPLVAGAEVLVVDAAEAADGVALRRRLVDSAASAMQATPATWRMLLAAGGVPPGLQVRICGGEALPRDLADELLTDDALLWNAYGPTETTVWSAAGLVRPSPEPVEIGPPIANTALYVLDRRLEPVGVGVVGEIHIGGLGVARGYAGRPALTADRFRPDPLGTVPGARIYATGDLARRRPNGSLEFLGRADSQVKLRGFRIELGEIEAVLRADDRVDDAVVGVWDAGAGDARLVAYLVPTGFPAAGADTDDVWPEVRERARRRLPDYMVPAACVLLDALPLTPNGKTDRAALPPPVRGGSDLADRVPPRTPVEQVLADIFAAVLGIATTGTATGAAADGAGVGAYDDFFALGGHSLLAAKVLARIRGVFGIELPIRRLFEAPTPAGTAAALVELEDGPGQVELIAKLRQQVDQMPAERVRSLLSDGPGGGAPGDAR